jgi:hypothetical protein
MWIAGKRRVVELERVLAPQEILNRVYATFGNPVETLLSVSKCPLVLLKMLFTNIQAGDDNNWIILYQLPRLPDSASMPDMMSRISLVIVLWRSS